MMWMENLYWALGYVWLMRWWMGEEEALRLAEKAFAWAEDDNYEH